MRSVLIGIAIAGVPITLWTVFVEIPRIRLSLFRYELWELRDELADKLLRRELKGPAVADQLLNGVEATIRGVQTHSLERVILVAVATRLGYLQDPRTIVPVDALRPHANQEDLQYLDDWNDRVEVSIARFMLRGSPLGWCVFLIITAAKPLHAKWIDRKRGGATKIAQATARLRGDADAQPMHALVA